METLPDVERARKLMSEAIDWSVVKWLAEKKKVRRAADKANEILNSEETKLQTQWGTKFRSLYDGSGTGPQHMKELAKRIREEHEAANRFRMDAEATFDQAEKRLSTALAREGCRQAITGWDHHLEAIRLAGSAVQLG